MQESTDHIAELAREGPARTGGPRAVRCRLRGAWTRQVRFVLSRGVCYLAIGLCALILTDLVLDWLLRLPGSARLALLALNAVVLGWTAYARLVRHLRGFDELRTALQVEREYPGLQSLLASGVEFSAGRATQGSSPALMRAVERQAVERTAAMDFGRIVRFRELRGLAAAAAVGLAVVVGLVIAQPQMFWVLANRMVNPYCTLAYPTRTQIEMLTGDITVRASESVAIAARALDEVPEVGILYVCFAGAGWERIELQPQAEDKFRYVFHRVRTDFEYQFRLGDAESARHRVTVAYPPRIAAVRIRLVYPEYLGIGPDEVDSLNLKAYEGTRVHWQLETDRPVVAAEMALEDGEELSATSISSAGRIVQFEATAKASAPYRFRFHWELGDRTCVDEGTKHYVQVIPDNEPHVRLTFPAEDEKATLHRDMRLAFSATDDHGLAKAWIVFSLNAGGEQRREIGDLQDKASVQREVAWPIRESIPDLRLGDIVSYAIEVADGRLSGDGARRSRSRSRRVQFVSDDEYLRYVLARTRRTLGQLRPLYLQQREAAGAMRKVGFRDNANGPGGDRLTITNSEIAP